jgi:hypothetical protein
MLIGDFAGSISRIRIDIPPSQFYGRPQAVTPAALEESIDPEIPFRLIIP